MGAWDPTQGGGPWSPTHMAPLTDHLRGRCSLLSLRSPAGAKTWPRVAAGAAPEQTSRAAVASPSTPPRPPCTSAHGPGTRRLHAARTRVAAQKPVPQRNAQSRREAFKDGKQGPLCTAGPHSRQHCPHTPRRGPPDTHTWRIGELHGVRAHNRASSSHERADCDVCGNMVHLRHSAVTQARQTSHFMGLHFHGKDH